MTDLLEGASMVDGEDEGWSCEEAGCDLCPLTG